MGTNKVTLWSRRIINVYIYIYMYSYYIHMKLFIYTHIHTHLNIHTYLVNGGFLYILEGSNF